MAYTYGCCGLEQIVDRHGSITRYEYDQNHRRVATLDHFDNRTEFTYDGNGNQVKVRDPLANETVTAYDLLNRPATITYPDQTTEAFEHDALGRQTRHTDRSGRVTITEYDARGSVTATKVEVPGDPDPIVYTLSTTTYNLADRQASTTNANGLTIGYGYDALGRVTTETYPDNTSVSRVYGLAGMTSQTDRLGNTTAFTYDVAGRVLTVTDALNHTTTYTYNAAGHQATVTNALAQTTSFAYDQEGRLVTTTHSDDSTETRAHAKDGLLFPPGSKFLSVGRVRGRGPPRRMAAETPASTSGLAPRTGCARTPVTAGPAPAPELTGLACRAILLDLR